MIVKILLCKKPGTFDEPLLYEVPHELESSLAIGQWVQVPFRLHLARGIVVEYPSQVSADLKDKEIRSIGKILPEEPLTPAQIQLSRFMAGYYQTSLTRTLRLMIPKQIWEGRFKSPEPITNHSYCHSERPVPFWTGRGSEESHPLLNSLHNEFAGEIPRSARNDIRASEELFRTLPLKPFDHILTPEQERALTQIHKSSKPVLLHGVTGSGKTELYLRLILESVKEKKQSILLVPEIALTPQMIAYFKAYFGESIAVFHSRLTDKKKAIEWWRVRRGEAALVIGSRSALFAPVQSLGTLIIDEEHEWTYKQESSPYYQAHTVAERWAELQGGRLLLGSATPRLESYEKAKRGVYTLVTLQERIHQAIFPAITVVDLREEFKKKNFSIFSELLKKKMEETLKRGEQLLLFVNQRGVARAVVCRDCGHTELCPHCDIALKYHRGNSGKRSVISGKQSALTAYCLPLIPDQLLCHYCGFTQTPPTLCPTCSSPYIKYMGVGTQKVEEEVKKLFPGARVARADRDTTKGKDGFSPLYHAFLNREYDVLVGTQMIAKGLDFSGVSLVGLVLADIGLHLPDFRSSERLFQLITQVAGRCGRNLKNPGEVILQTYQPEHPAIRQAARYGYQPFADEELSARQKGGYPPFGRLIKFTVVGTDLGHLQTHINEATETLEDITRTHELSIKVSGAPALIPKLSNRYYYQVLLRGENPEQLFDYWKIPKGWRVDIDPIHTA